MYGILLAIHVITAFCLIGLVLIQQGKGAQAGAAFGSGASQTVFGSVGSTGFLSRATAILAALFFILNLALAYIVNQNKHAVSLANPAEQTMPVETQTATEPTVQENGDNTTNGVGPSDIPD